MTSVKSCDCFSTVISQFSLNIEHSHMMKRILLSSDKLHEDKVFKILVNHILKSTTSVLEKQQYQYDKIEITNMWSNTLNSGESHPPHTHSNNFLSGVYYLKAGNTSPIQFFDPRPAAHVLQPRNTPNFINSSMVEFDSIEGVGYIFPSWLSHWVPPTKEQRVSVSWNILLRGHYGEHGTLQNAYI
jgi:uncharacterized protein (TIGR02466 family)